MTTTPLTATTVFTLVCTGAGGSGQASATVTVGTTQVFPLRTEVGKRYLVTGQGNAFLIHGDTPWSLIVMLTREQVEQYLETRRQQGFNTVLVELIEHEFSTNPPRNVYGDAPFTTAGDFATPNETYFAHAEYVIAKAAEKGMLVMLTPAYMGSGGGSQGWYQEMQANGVTKLRNYGRYVATRFAAYNNILWVHGGDFDPPEKNLTRAIVDGIRDIDTTGKWLHTFHGARGTGALEFWGTGEPWLNVNNIYTNESTVVAEAFGQYNASTMPFFLIEAGYEGESASFRGAATRMQAYQAVLSGASGQLMGNWPVWFFGSGWQAALTSEAGTTMGHLRSLLEARLWWNLMPDVNGTTLTSNPGSGSGRAAAARMSDGSQVLVFTPGLQTLAINMTRLTGPSVRVRWYDPTNGSYTTISGSPFAASGSRSFTAPNNNNGGDRDFVLVLESAP